MSKVKKVLITGSAGFIGSHLVKSCVNLGHKVYGADNLSRRGTSHNLEYLTKNCDSFFNHNLIDLTDLESLQELFKKHGPFDWIAHEAGQVAVTTSLKSPLNDFRSNALATLNLLECVRSQSPDAKLAFASTNKVYGELRGLEIEESDRKYRFADGILGVSESQALDFHSPYGCSKGTADQYVCDYARSFGLKTVCFRQSCIYGTRQFGLEDQGWVAWFLIAAALKKPFKIFGNGKQVRDLLWIEDLCDAYLRFWQKDTFPWGTAINLGGGLDNCLSLIELIENMQDLQIEFPYPEFDDWRTGDQKIFCSDNSKANDLLDWSPQTSTKTGISKLWNWVQENISEIENLLNSSH